MVLAGSSGPTGGLNDKKERVTCFLPKIGRGKFKMVSRENIGRDTRDDQPSLWSSHLIGLTGVLRNKALLDGIRNLTPRRTKPVKQRRVGRMGQKIKACGGGTALSPRT